ncbi:MAG: hypothetical protein DLM54_07425 [Acidimicrobiales bacterium]|nr:MAG: hypothetical protein DLM54_07425 [Acidimicrobiales bacterium]
MAIGAVCLAGLFLIWLTVLYGASWHVFLGNSDDANAVLEGHSLANGNLVLHGWSLSADSYWTTDLLFYALFSAVEGVRPALMHQVPMILAIGVVLLSAITSSLGFSRVGKWTGASATFLILGVPAWYLVSVFYQGPQHVGTTLFCLAAFLALSRMRLGRAWALGTLLMTAALVGDPFALPIGVIPLGLVGLATAVARRRWQLAVAPVGAALAAVGLSEIAFSLLRHFDGYTTYPVIPLSHPSQWPTNLGNALIQLWDLLGGQVTFSTRWEILVMAAHLLGMAAIVAGVAVASGRLVRDVMLRTQPSRYRRSVGSVLERFLVVAVWGNVATVLVLGGVARYLIPGLAFGAILGGRFVGATAAHLRARTAAHLRARTAAHLRARPSGAHRAAGGTYPVLVVPGLVVLAAIGYSASLASISHLPTRQDPARSLVTWLSASSLDHGIGTYWDGSLMTVNSDDQVGVRSVLSVHGRLLRYQTNSSASWYPPASSPLAARFLAYTPSQPWGGVNATSAIATFGPPSSSRQIGQYEVLIWDHGLATSG